MAIFVPEVAAPYLMKEIDKRLVLSNAALDISADVPEIEWKGSKITFPVYSRVAVADEVAAKGGVTATEIDGTSATADIKHFAAAIKYHKDSLRQSGGPILQNMAITDLADAIALKLDADLMATAIAGATLKAACAEADVINPAELEAAFALFGDRQNADEFAGIYINSKLFPFILGMEGFSATGLTYTTPGNGIVKGQCVGFYRGVPVMLTDNANRTGSTPECKTLIVKKGALAKARKAEPEFSEEYHATTFYTDVVADVYAAHKVLDDSKIVLLAKTIT